MPACRPLLAFSGFPSLAQLWSPLAVPLSASQVREEVNSLRDELARRCSELEDANRRLAAWKTLHERCAAATKGMLAAIDTHAPVFGLTAQANRFNAVQVCWVCLSFYDCPCRLVRVGLFPPFVLTRYREALTAACPAVWRRFVWLLFRLVCCCCCCWLVQVKCKALADAVSLKVPQGPVIVSASNVRGSPGRAAWCLLCRGVYAPVPDRSVFSLRAPAACFSWSTRRRS